MGDFWFAPGEGILPVVRHFACGSWVGECPIAFVGLGLAKSLGGLVHSNGLWTWTTLTLPTRLGAHRGEGWPSRRPEPSKIVACWCLFSLDMSMHLKNSAVVCE